MKTSNSFAGFPEELISYYKNIEQNNNRSWFHEHKQDFEKYVMNPARAFVTELGMRLMTISPYIYAEPKVNRSIFRIARDVRRNKEKPPYKTQLSLIFWETHLPRLEAPGFYCAISKDQLMLGGGIYWTNSDFLRVYREAVVEKEMGEELKKIAKDLRIKGYELEGKEYKRIPHGYTTNDRNADFLLHKALYIYTEQAHPTELHSEKFLDYVFEKYLDFAPLHNWLAKVAKRMKK